ncbi:MAG: hypothetical protein ACRCX2_35660 [Paraclostridium sp.]
MGVSRAQLHMSKCLNKICKAYGITLIEELTKGDKRYDFYIPTFPPVVIEVDGCQHEATKADGHFFKSSEQLEKYKRNDYERRMEHKLGKIRMYRFTDQDFPSVGELVDLLERHLKNGENEEDANLKRIRFNQERDRKTREFNKRVREESKRRNSNRD